MGGTARIVVDAGVELPAGGWDWELRDLPEAWPYLGPSWLRATEAALPEARPAHTLGRRHDGEVAVLPGFVFEQPPAVDWDPRTYLGWQPPSGAEVCCGVETCSDTVGAVDALGAEPFFPALVLGSPLGYRTELMFTFWTPQLAYDLVARAVDTAFARGVRSVVAPWIPARMGNDRLVEALRAAGCDTAFWGVEDYLEIRHPDWDAYVGDLPARRRQRVRLDLQSIEDLGVTIERVDGADLAPHVDRIAELTCLNREKNGAGEEPAHIEVVLRGLLADGVDVRAHLARLDGDVVGSCVTIAKSGRLFIKWTGFDYGRLGGERSGVYFPLVLHRPVMDAHAEGLRFVEAGAGAHQAKALRGFSPRTVTTALAVADHSLRPQVAGWLADFGARRRRAFDLPADGTELALVPSQGDTGGCCASG